MQPDRLSQSCQRLAELQLHSTILYLGQKDELIEGKTISKFTHKVCFNQGRIASNYDTLDLYFIRGSNITRQPLLSIASDTVRFFPFAVQHISIKRDNRFVSLIYISILFFNHKSDIPYSSRLTGFIVHVNTFVDENFCTFN